MGDPPEGVRRAGFLAAVDKVVPSVFDVIPYNVRTFSAIYIKIDAVRL
ncbi:MAG: hypothetical protein Q3965_02435 [Rothia sp. (in: high G+C Gram-positive bacteria)]|nr:hypothetical protein [Rothia sp. (in: high G+C Gram-positive bacteria)]